MSFHRTTPLPPAREIKKLLVPIVKRLPGYIKLAWMLAKEPSIPLVHRSGLYLTVVYVLSPAHLAANIVPVFGQVDWILLLMLSIRQALVHCPPEVLARLHTLAKLQPQQLDADLATLTRLCRGGAEAACAALSRKLPATGPMGKKVAFAGRVANGFTRRVIGRIRTAA